MKTYPHRQFPASRMRRLRQNDFTRTMARESTLNAHNLIQPMFIIEGNKINQPIQSMPAINRLSIDQLLKQAETSHKLGIPAIALFPVIESNKKSSDGAEAYNPEGLVPRAIQALKQALPALGVISDVALDPYTNHGQDGVIDSSGYVVNDLSVLQLNKQALMHAQAGADIIAPSDMMDGRIASIRNNLEKNKLHNTLILAYAAKYASHYYGPFRDALDSNKNLAQKSKSSYQMDIANSDEALHECLLDLNEGADMIMIKPAMPCLDIIHRVKKELMVPTFAYQVSGEYAMHRAAIQQQYLKEETILESLQCIKRAGADMILTYFANNIAAKLAR